MDKIYDLKLHEKTNIGNTDVAVVRVPGGWIYRFFDFDIESIGSVFVPFDNEFRKPKTTIGR